MAAGLLYQGQCLGNDAYLVSLAGQSVGPGIIHSCSFVVDDVSCSLLHADNTTTSFTFTPPACADTTPVTAEWYSYIVYAFVFAFITRKTLKLIARFMSAGDLA